jgi:hypothetical protein
MRSPGLLSWLVGILLLLAGCGGSPTASDGSTEAGWGPRVVLADLAVFDSPVGPSLDGDGAGNSIAVWAPSTRDYAPVLARRYSAREGWLPVETIAAAGNGSVNTPTVRMNARGDVVAIWDGYAGLAASAATGRSWESPVIIGRSAAQKWSWGLDDEGRALVVWLSGRSVLTSRLEPGSGWLQPTPLPGAESQASLLETPTIAVSGSGHAIAAWSRAQSPGVDDELLANAFDPREGWSAPLRLGPQQAESRALQATAFMSSEGDGLLCWYESAVVGGALYASRYARTTGFGPAELLGASAGSATAAAIEPSGNVMVIYQSGPGLRRQRYLVGRGWQPPEPFEDVGGYDAVPLDDQGNGSALWNERIGSDSVSLRSRRLASGLAVGPVEEVAPPFTGYAWFRGVPMDANGGMLAAWFQRVSPLGDAGRYALVASRFQAE